MSQPVHITRLLELMAQFKPKSSAEKDAHRLEFQHRGKSVVIFWPNLVMEVFFDFIEGGEKLLAESVEYYDSESPETQAQDIAEIAQRFLLNETRLVTVGSLLKRREIQYCRASEWMTIFQ